MDLLKRFLSAIAGSKKAIATIATIVFMFLAPLLTRVGVTITEEEVQQVIALVVAYLIGQGIADAGKEKAKIESAAKAGAATTVSGEIQS